MIAGFAFCGFDIGRQPGLIDAVFFLAVWAGNFHFRIIAYKRAGFNGEYI